MSLVKLVYNVGNLAQIAALAAMKYRDMILAHNIPPTIAAREYLTAELKRIDGVTVYDSVTNFVLIRVPDGPAVVKALREGRHLRPLLQGRGPAELPAHYRYDEGRRTKSCRSDSKGGRPCVAPR